MSKKEEKIRNINEMIRKNDQKIKKLQAINQIHLQEIKKLRNSEELSFENSTEYRRTQSQADKTAFNKKLDNTLASLAAHGVDVASRLI